GGSGRNDDCQVTPMKSSRARLFGLGALILTGLFAATLILLWTSEPNLRGDPIPKANCGRINRLGMDETEAEDRVGCPAHHRGRPRDRSLDDILVASGWSVDDRDNRKPERESLWKTTGGGVLIIQFDSTGKSCYSAWMRKHSVGDIGGKII